MWLSLAIKFMALSTQLHTGVPATRTRYALASKIGLLAGGGAAGGAGGAERLRQILGATANWIPKARPRTRPPGPGRGTGTGGRARGQGPGAHKKHVLIAEIL